MADPKQAHGKPVACTAAAAAAAPAVVVNRWHLHILCRRGCAFAVGPTAAAAWRENGHGIAMRARMGHLPDQGPRTRAAWHLGKKREGLGVPADGMQTGPDQPVALHSRSGTLL